MDGSAFSKLPVGPLIWFAIIGLVATVLGGLAGLITGVWWLSNHIQFV